MNLTFGRNGSVFQITAQLRVPGHSEKIAFVAQHDLGNGYYAAFVVDAARSQLAQVMTTIRQEAYEKGWKDAKSKKTPKAKRWSSWFGVGR